MQHKIRLLDIDDLMILRHLGTGHNLASAAKNLGITQSAVTQRLRKLEDVFFPNIVQRKGRESELTSEGHVLCEQIKLALSSIELIGEKIDELRKKEGSSVPVQDSVDIMSA